MKALIQRVLRASVTVDGETVGSIDNGLLVFFGAADGDGEAECEKLADKISKLRIFSDENDKTNLSINDVGGSVLVISQFTLCADCSHGSRPSFINACAPDKAERLYEHFKQLIAQKINGKTACGCFGADMKVELLNDGPFTIMLECIGGKIL